MTELFRRISWLLNRRRAECELAEEMDAHLAESEADGRRNPAFGSTLRHLESTREVWGWTWIDRLFQDLSYALRLLRKSRPSSSLHSSYSPWALALTSLPFAFCSLKSPPPSATPTPSSNSPAGSPMAPATPSPG